MMAGSPMVLPVVLLAAALAGPGDDLAGDVVRPFLEGVKGKVSSSSALTSHRQEVRVLLADVDRRAAERIADPVARVAATSSARKALSDGLVAERGGEETRREVEALVEAARGEGIQMRRDFLLRSLVCWCPKEEWTRTVAGCAEGCADEQKDLVAQWLAQGYTDEEILARMVAHPKGGPRVRAAPDATGTNLIGYVAPFAIFGAAAGVAVLALRRVIRRRSKEGRAGVARPAARSDEELADRIERELKEMET
jgi:cytochrome c-type biogenesis protein CcmH/NrfF